MKTEFYIIGDSHAGALAQGAKQLGCKFSGGPMMAGRNMIDPFCYAENDEFVIAEDKPCLDRVRIELKPMLMSGCPVLSTVGFNINWFAEMSLRGFTVNTSRGDRNYISREVFRRCALEFANGAIEFYKLLKKYNLDIYAVYSPQRIDLDYLEVANRYDEIFAAEINELGVKLIDVRAATCDAHGCLKSEYSAAKGDDHLHANAAFGKIVIKEFLKKAFHR